MAGSSGDGGSTGKNTFLVAFVVALVLFTSVGVFFMSFARALLWAGATALLIAFVVDFFADSSIADWLRRRDTHSSGMRNMKQPPPFRLWGGFWKWVWYSLTHGIPIPGPWTDAVPEDEYHHTSTPERYRGKEFKETKWKKPGHPEDVKLKARGEDVD